jgi:hypothetical protein
MDRELKQYGSLIYIEVNHQLSFIARLGKRTRTRAR